MIKTLLINSAYEPLAFITFERAIRLIINRKVEIISNWDEEINWVSGSIKHPSILKLQYYVNPNRTRIRVRKKEVFRRDQYTCQYCGLVLTSAKATWDHIIPVSLGGKSTWNNVVCCCKGCNSFKGNRTPEQAEMKLLNKPEMPKNIVSNEFILMVDKHVDWAFYFSAIEHVESKPHI